MGENSKIEWTDHTFNPWVGCSKVHEGCQFCYAEINQFVRFKNVKWGDQGKRVLTSDENWKRPLDWNKAAKEDGQRARVFCASLSDVFEDRPELVDPRRRLFELIDATPHLDWLLLTKRPQHVLDLWPCSLDRGDGSKHFCARTDWHCKQHRPNVWLGTSVSKQEHADKQIPELLESNQRELPGIEPSKRLAAGTFLSIEPMLGPVNLMAQADWFWSSNIKWVIAGGESGPKARPVHPDWIRGLRDQCTAAGVPFFFKQWGEWGPKHVSTGGPWIDRTEADMIRVGKRKAGAMLDGREWRETPFATVPV